MTCYLLFSALQAAGSGAVAASIAASNWPVTFIACFLMNQLWWFNMGKRIEYHGRPWAGTLYSVASAIGVLAGAWWWR